MACVRVCPADAVAVEGSQIRIVDETCTRCGLCVPACPHDAIKAAGDLPRALELALSGRAALIVGVECAVFFYPATPEQVVNACYAAGFRTVHRGVLGDELVAKEYLTLWADEGWGSMIRSTCPVIVETVRTQYPELIPYLAPIATPIAAEARYLKGLHGADTPLVYAGVCLTEGGQDVDAAITFDELADLFRRRGVKVEDQAPYFTRVPEERRRHLSTAGGLPLELLMEETHARPRFRQGGGPGGLERIAPAGAGPAGGAGGGRRRWGGGPPYLDKVGRQAQLQAAVDGVTGLATYRVLRDRLASEVARSDRTQDPFAVLFVDLDNFKQVNDRFGHEAGNDVLRSTARECAAHIRTTDLAARYGGDEFVLVVVHTGLEGARVVADKVRTGVEVMGRDLGYPPGLVTVSIGGAELG